MGRVLRRHALHVSPLRRLPKGGHQATHKARQARAPEDFTITAYKGFDKGQKWPIGKGRRLDTNLRPVERDGKTVAWNIFFRVNEPGRHYYLDTFALWKQVPNTHISSGDATYFFHVRTR